MIDWFPTPPGDGSSSAQLDLLRWQGFVQLRALGRRIDALDPTTSGHSERVALLAARLAVELGWSGVRVRQLREAALVHDVGKAAVPQEVLLTPGGLSFEQYEIVKAHAAIGAEIVASVLSPRQASWVRHHHERWDGRGYPDGIAGEEIPAGAAVLAVADAWDAMRRRAWTGRPLGVAEAMEECRRESGGQFAPWAVEALEAVVSVEPPLVPARRAPAAALARAA
jgi:putative nucleotidyltransferase with HDIG domain